MLSEIQFHHIVNNVLNLECCRRAGVNLLDMDDNQNEQSATFSLGASKRPVWKLVNNGKGVYMFNANGLLFKMFFNDDMTPDKATVAQMAKLIKRMSCTVLNVITSIINGMYIYEKDPSYYLEYPNIEDFYGNSATAHMILRFPNTGNAVRLADADRIPEMNQNIADVDYLIADIVGIRSIPAINPNPEDNKPCYNTFESPLFRIVIKNGVLAYTRYTNIEGIKTQNEETGDIDFVKMTQPDFKKFIAETNKPRLSRKTTKIDINAAMNAKDDPEQMDSDPKYEPQELSNKILYDIDHNWTKDDKASSGTKFTDTGSIALIGYRAVLESKRKICTIKDPNTRSAISSMQMVGYALDDFLDCYPIKPNDIRIGITRGAEYPVCISYASPSGIIAELYITPEESVLHDADNLLDKKNFFAVNKDDRILLKYNKGSNQLVSEELRSIDVAFTHIRDLISLRAVVDDISRTVYHTLAETQWSEKSLKDEHIATTSVDMNPRKADVEIHSLVSDVHIPIKLIIENNASGGAQITCTLNNVKDNEYVFSAEHKQSVIDQYEILDDAVDADEDGLLKDPQARLGKYGQLFGAALSVAVETAFSQFIQSNMKGLRSVSSENQQENLYNALKFRYGDGENTVLGDLLLDVRDAFVETFGENVVGTPDKPSKVSPVLNIGEFNYGISKPVKTDKGTKYVQVNASFLVNHGACGSFTASYDRKTKEPKVMCQMGGDKYMRADHLVDGRLSHQFLQWYLLSKPGSLVTSALIKCIENGETTVYVKDKTGKPTDKVLYRIDPEIVDILAPYARESHEFAEHPVNRDMSGRAPGMNVNDASVLPPELRQETDSHYGAMSIPDEDYDITDDTDSDEEETEDLVLDDDE